MGVLYEALAQRWRTRAADFDAWVHEVAHGRRLPNGADAHAKRVANTRSRLHPADGSVAVLARLWIVREAHGMWPGGLPIQEIELVERCMPFLIEAYIHYRSEHAV
jgi:hypothetical protein